MVVAKFVVVVVFVVVVDVLSQKPNFKAWPEFGQ